MILKLFFNRHSPIVYLLALLSIFLMREHATSLSSPFDWRDGHLLGIVLLHGLYALIILCRLWPWYTRWADRGHGIEEHFAKMFVAGVYIDVAMAGLFHLTEWSVFPWIGAGVLAWLLWTNLQMIIHHLKDKSAIPPSYHSRSLYE